MARLLVAVGFAALVSACGTFTGTVASDPNREVLGVVANQPKGPEGSKVVTETSQEKLAYSARQLCSTGYDVIGEDLSPGDNDRQFVDNELRCKPYHFNLFGADLAGIVPY